MALIVMDLLERAGRLLNDEGRVRWTSSELIDWINDGQYAICAIDPAAYTAEVEITLVEGVRQTLPVGAIRLIGEVYNAGDSSVVTQCDREALDAAVNDWRNAAGADTTVVHYMYNPQASLREFLVFPPQPADTGATLFAVVSRDPPAATAASTLPLAEKYREPLLNYIVYRAFSKDSEEGSGQLAQAYYTAFEATMAKVTGNAAK